MALAQLRPFSCLQVPDGCVGMSPGSSRSEDGDVSGGASLVVPGGAQLMKSVSTPAIPSIDLRNKVHDRRSGTISEVTDANNHPTNFEDDEDRPKREVKEEKKRRSSVFSKLGSKRQKKGWKDGKSLKTTHQFVQVSVSNSKACDVCNKSMANKAALQCENCMVNVHENSCKDQIAPCARYRHPKLQRQDSAQDKLTKFQSSSLPGGTTNTRVKSSQSFKERNRAASVPARPFQLHQSTSALPRPGQTG
jgi:hypothetical protein